MMSAERVYRALMHAYPPGFRSAFGREMTLVLRDQQRDGAVTWRYWIALVAEIAATAPRLWAEELHESFLMRTMMLKLMSVLSMLVGVLETVNTLLESHAGPVGQRDALSRSLLILLIASTVLLTFAGLALLLRGRAAQTTGRVAAISCLGAFAIMVATRPMMSIAATAVGLAAPVALLVALGTKPTHWNNATPS
jgi:hypothetical protein